MNPRTATFLLTLFVVALASSCDLQAAAPAFTAAAATSEPRIDGLLDDSVWNAATRVPLVVETAPGDNLPARVATTCFLAVGPTDLFLGCRAADPNRRAIRAYVSDRDATDGQDRIVLLVDTFNDARRAYRFAVNALGVQEDGIFDQQKSETDSSWDAAWRSAGRVSEEGYAVEAAIPLTALRYPETREPQTWRFTIVREQPRSDKVELRPAALDRSNSCALCQASELRGVAAHSAGRDLDLVPAVAIVKSDTRESNTGPLEQGAVMRAGSFDLRWGLSSNLTLSATVNPDFSQVETDVPQLAANARFALMYPEKRPFFLEGADFFSTPVRAVFTRSIADPDFGLKLTGKVGSNVVGLMAASDVANHVVLPGSQGSRSLTIDGGARTVVGRLRRDVGASSTIGLLYTGRNGTAYSNHAAGVDAFLRPVKPLTLRVQLLGSQTKYPLGSERATEQSADRIAGVALQSDTQFETRRWIAASTVRRFDANFRADAGFVPQVDVHFANLWAGRRFWGGRDAWFTKITLLSGGWRTDRADGEPLSHGSFAEIIYEGPLQTTLDIVPNRWREWFEGTAYDLNTLWMTAAIQPWRNVSFNLLTVVGDAIDTANGRRAGNLRVEPAVRWRIGRRGEVQLAHARQRLSTDGQASLIDQFLRLRMAYNFSSRTFVRTVLQWGQTAREPLLYRAPTAFEDQNLSSQFVFAYRVDPQTALFLGYGDQRDGRIDAAGLRSPVRLTGRTLFLKLGYAWRP